jgi:D-threo-aldose 1-dehydrogenase
MAHRTILLKSGLEISRLGLGLAGWHQVNSEGREKLFQSALDLGITHFDTARFYSDGMSETTLGHLLPKDRASITIATKFGLLPTPLIGSMGPAAPLARKGRSLFRKLGLLQYPKRSYSRATMQKSLRDSLRALKTDYIDIYLLHEPLNSTMPEEDLFEELVREKKKGSIRFIGVSGEQIDPIVARYGNILDVIQSAEATWSEERFVPDITHSLFSGNVSRTSPALKEDSVQALLEQALARRKNGAVIVQTRRPAHLEKLAAWAEGK